MNQEKVGMFIASLRKEKKMTQEELAEKLGVSDRTISKWENGRGMPDLSLFKPLCDTLGISISELFAGQRINKEDFINKNDEVIIKLAEINSYKSMRYGVIGMALFFMILVLISAFKDMSCSALVSLICAYNSITFLSNYKFTKRKEELLPGVLFLIAAILNTISFILM